MDIDKNVAEFMEQLKKEKNQIQMEENKEENMQVENEAQEDKVTLSQLKAKRKGVEDNDENFLARVKVIYFIYFYSSLFKLSSNFKDEKLYISK